jgi:hypothetical protein
MMGVDQEELEQQAKYLRGLSGYGSSSGWTALASAINDLHAAIENMRECPDFYVRKGYTRDDLRRLVKMLGG